VNKSQREALTKALAAYVTAIAADLRAQMLAEGPVRTRAKQLHADEKVGDDFDVWTDLLSRRAAVLWALKTVYVRVLEDRGLLRPGRLLDPEAQHLFEKLAPNLGETAFLTWVFRDLASSRGGLPELFAPQPAEVALPGDALSRALIAFWREKDTDTGELRWSFAAEEFAGELMGDLYQELDPVVKDRYALCQTPDFVRDFMLAQTLTPAIVELGADNVRVLDPACGSGHFLLDAMRRLVAATAEQHADWSKRRVVEHVLDRVVGIDLNDYACALARARLVMTAAELAGVRTLVDAAAFHPNVYWADGLEQIERDEEDRGPAQLDLLGPNKVAPPRAVLTRPHVRAVLRPLLKQKFHVVVGNPPYITERDAARKQYHRAIVGAGKQKKRRYFSAYREYSLAAPFIERTFQLAQSDGRVGLIVGNNFMKREFGKPLIEDVLADVDLQLVVDTSNAFIPHHGTPTVMLFARNRAPQGEHVRAVMGKRGEPGTPEDPRKGKVWSSIIEAHATSGYDGEFVSVADVARTTFSKHPWSLGGGGLAELRGSLDRRASKKLGAESDIGVICMTRADDIYVGRRSDFTRFGITSPFARCFPLGNSLRDWALSSDSEFAVFPYDRDLKPVSAAEAPSVHRFLWPFRTVLWERREPNGNHRQIGLTWWEWSRLIRRRLEDPMTIAFAKIAATNHFVLSRGEALFSDGTPCVKLPSGANEDHYFALLGLLNSSTACFWMKQVFHAKAAGGIGRGLEPEPWMERYEYDATKMQLFPLPEGHVRLVSWARELDRVARRRANRSVAGVLSEDGWRHAPELRNLLDARRGADLADLEQMVALQEELDWECYQLYGVDTAPALSPDRTKPIPPNWRPVELDLATRDAETRAAIARGDETTEIPTAWFERHGWEPLSDLPGEAPNAVRDLISARRARIANNSELRLIEQPTYKRRWYRPDHDGEEHAALGMWLADRIEQVLTNRKGKPGTLVQITAALEEDPRVHAVAELLAGRRDYKLSELVAELVAADAVPDHPLHVFKPAGLEKRKAWERMWDEQRKEDAGLPANPEVPAKYGKADFLKPDYFRLRGNFDIAKERFVAYTQVPGRGAGETLYGWAGWTPTERVKALLAIDEECEDQGIELGDRIAVLDSAWRLLPDVARDDATTAARLKAELAAIVGPEGPSKVMMDAWKEKFPPPNKGRGKAKAVVVADDEDDDA
jgi:hypothetical protein